MIAGKRVDAPCGEQSDINELLIEKAGSAENDGGWQMTVNSGLRGFVIAAPAPAPARRRLPPL